SIIWVWGRSTTYRLDPDSWTETDANRQYLGGSIRFTTRHCWPSGAVRKAFLFLEGESMGEKVTVPDIVKKKHQGEKITCLTAYDYSFARILDQAGIDILFVGDSVGCVFQGQANTLPVTMEEMIYTTPAA